MIPKKDLSIRMVNVSVNQESLLKTINVFNVPDLYLIVKNVLLKANALLAFNHSSLLKDSVAVRKGTLLIVTSVQNVERLVYSVVD